MKKRICLFLVAMLLCASVFGESWYICLGSFKKIEYASEYCNNLSSQGYSVVIEKTEVKGSQFYRVLLAQRYGDRNLARSKKDEYVKKLNKKDLWIVSTELKNTVKPEVKKEIKEEVKEETSVQPVVKVPVESAKSIAPVETPVVPPAFEQIQVEEVNSSQASEPVTEESPIVEEVIPAEKETAPEIVAEPIQETPTAPIVEESPILNIEDMDKSVEVESSTEIENVAPVTLEVEQSAEPQEISATQESSVETEAEVETEQSQQNDSQVQLTNQTDFDEEDDPNIVHGISRLPLGFPEEMESVLKLIPVYNNYAMQKAEVYNIPNLKGIKFSVEKKEVRDIKIGDLKIDESKVLSYAYVEFKDEWRNKNFAMSIKYAKKGTFSKTERLFNKGKEKFIGQMCGKEVKFVYHEEGNSKFYIGLTDKEDVIYIIQTSDFDSQEFATLLTESNPSKSVYDMGYTKRTLMSIPNNKSYKKQIVKFDLEKFTATTASTVTQNLSSQLLGKWKSSCLFKYKKTQMWIDSIDFAYENIAMQAFDQYCADRQAESYTPLKVKGSPTNYYDGTETDQMVMRESCLIIATCAKHSDKIKKDILKSVCELYKVFN